MNKYAIFVQKIKVFSKKMVFVNFVLKIVKFVIINLLVLNVILIFILCQIILVKNVLFKTDILYKDFFVYLAFKIAKYVQNKKFVINVKIHTTFPWLENVKYVKLRMVFLYTTIIIVFHVLHNVRNVPTKINATNAKAAII